MQNANRCGWSLLRNALGVFDNFTSCQRNISVHAGSYANSGMTVDARRRQGVKEYSDIRMRLRCINRNNVLPKAIQVKAGRQLESLPKDSRPWLLRDRCAVTGRPRGVVYRWRFSRIQWRLYADYNKMSGLQRAMW